MNTHSRKSKILIVEDSKDIAQLITDQLRNIGFGVIDTVDNGVDAYNLCVKKISEGSDYDLIISDFKMPRMNGLELLRKIRENALLKKTKFILITGFGEAGMIQESMSLSVNDLITKPFEQNTLQDKIRRLLPHSEHPKRKHS